MLEIYRLGSEKVHYCIFFFTHKLFFPHIKYVQLLNSLLFFIFIHIQTLKFLSLFSSNKCFGDHNSAFMKAKTRWHGGVPDPSDWKEQNFQNINFQRDSKMVVDGFNNFDSGQSYLNSILNKCMHFFLNFATHSLLRLSILYAGFHAFDQDHLYVFWPLL